MIMELIGKIPLSATKPIAKGAKDLRQVQERLAGMYEVFEFFINGAWTYRNDNIYSVLNRLSDEEKESFDCDV